MKHTMIWTLCTAILLSAGCEDSSKSSYTPPTGNQETKATPTPSSSSSEQKESNKWKSGVTTANDGDKIGMVRLHGSIPAVDGTMLYLYETEARNLNLMDSTRVQNKQFDFGRIEVHRGFYQLATSNAKNNCQFILNPDEADLNLTFRTNQLSSKSAPQSAENRAWFTYDNFSRANNNQIRGLRKELNSSPYKAQIEQQIAAKEMELVQKQHELIDANPDTYIAKFLGWKNPRHPDSKGMYFDDLNPLDNSLIRSMAISDRIQGFMIAFSKGTDAGFIECIDLVKAHFEPNPETLESALYSMLEGMYNTGKEHICQYILDNYIFDEDCGADLSDVLRQRAEGIVNLQVGKVPPNFTMDRWDGGSVNLMETAKANKYTLVMFWASWCHKCEQEIPELVNLYPNFSNKGFEAIGVSLDQARQTWTGVISQRGMQYPNVSQLQGWDSPIVKQYKITATPTYFLLNSQGEIVLKPERIFQVRDFLSKNL